MMAVLQLLRKAGRTAEAPMCEAVRIAGRSLHYTWTRRRLDASLERLAEAGAVAKVGDSYELRPAMLSASPRVADPAPGDYVEFVALSGRRHYYSLRCAADLLALDDVLGETPITTTHVLLAFEVLGVDWSIDAVEDTLGAMQLESGDRFRREGMVKFDNPFALMESVEGYIAEKSREYAA
jgi:hypothetical protein